LQQCCALLFQPYKAKAACLSGQRVYRFDCCITIVPTQGIVQFRTARLVQKSDQKFLQHILVVKPAAGCFKISIYCLIKFMQRHIDISLCIFYHFKNRLARGENSFLSPFLDKDRGLQ
jgi:hypothetical protein